MSATVQQATENLKGKVLVVEDQSILYRPLDAVLDDAGYDVILAHSKEDALDILKQASMDKAEFSAIIVDNTLLDGDTGIPLIEAIRSGECGKHKHSMIFFRSSTVGPADREPSPEAKAAIDAGADWCLGKLKTQDVIDALETPRVYTNGILNAAETARCSIERNRQIANGGNTL